MVCLDTVPDDFSVDEVDNIFGDVGREVGDALEMARGRKKMSCPFYGRRIGFHDIGKLLVYTSVRLIDDVVFCANFSCQFDIGVQ